MAAPSQWEESGAGRGRGGTREGQQAARGLSEGQRRPLDCKERPQSLWTVPARGAGSRPLWASSGGKKRKRGGTAGSSTAGQETLWGSDGRNRALGTRGCARSFPFWPGRAGTVAKR